jgi:hypothetical protein
MEVTFHNVTITIKAKSPREAYDKLCDALAHLPGVLSEFTTDTYTADNGDQGYTSELWG